VVAVGYTVENGLYLLSLGHTATGIISVGVLTMGVINFGHVGFGLLYSVVSGSGGGVSRKEEEEQNPS